MTSERLDALSVREDKNGKAWFSRIGCAFLNKDGKGYTLMLDAMPASADGQYKIMLREPLPKDGERGGSRHQSQNRQSSADKEVYNSNSGWSDDLDDDPMF